MRTRFMLFCELQRTVRLTDEEKRTAQNLAIDQLVALLRTLPSPPIHVYSHRQAERHRGRLLEQVEAAHSLQPRLNGILIQQAGQFAGLTI